MNEAVAAAVSKRLAPTQPNEWNSSLVDQRSYNLQNERDQTGTIAKPSDKTDALA